MGFRIFIHAIRLVFRNLAEALRVSFVPYLLFLLAVVAVVIVVAVSGLMAQLTGPNREWLTLPVGLVLIVVNVWVAVAWHRFILLGEGVPRAMPRFRTTRIAAYFARSFLIGFVLVPLGLLGLAIATLLENNLLNKLPEQLAQAATFVLIPLVFVPVAIALGRLSIVLPAAAVGKPLRWRDAWSATRSANFTVIVLTILVLAGYYILDLPVSLQIEAIPLPILVVWQLFATWIETLVVLAILSTLYAHYVEGRRVGSSEVTPTT